MKVCGKKNASFQFLLFFSLVHLEALMAIEQHFLITDTIEEQEDVSLRLHRPKGHPRGPFAGLGESCGAGLECEIGFSCEPGIHQCYHSPRLENQPCSSGYGCADGLECDYMEGDVLKCIRMDNPNDLGIEAYRYEPPFTEEPSSSPSFSPTSSPSAIPTSSPSAIPSPTPSFSPTSSPTALPTPYSNPRLHPRLFLPKIISAVLPTPKIGHFRALREESLLLRNVLQPVRVTSILEGSGGENVGVVMATMTSTVKQLDAIVMETMLVLGSSVSTEPIIWDVLKTPQTGRCPSTAEIKKLLMTVPKCARGSGSHILEGSGGDNVGVVMATMTSTAKQLDVIVKETMLVLGSSAFTRWCNKFFQFRKGPKRNFSRIILPIPQLTKFRKGDLEET